MRQEKLELARKSGHNRFAGNATIREQVMGKDCKRVARPEEIEKMAQLTWQALNEGAMGLSSGR